MCHDWWEWRMYEQREASRRLWKDFEESRPLSEPEPADEDVQIKLEERDTEPVADR